MSHRVRSFRGFTLVEAAISVAILGAVAVAIIRSVAASAAAHQANMDRLKARVLAEDLLGEIDAKEYSDPSGATTLGPDAGEVSGNSRAQFDDIDDYHGLTESPLRISDGSAIGGTSNLTRETAVSWVRPDNPKTVVAADATVKRIVVTVKRTGGKVLAQCETFRTKAYLKGARSLSTVTATSDVTAATPK